MTRQRALLTSLALVLGAFSAPALAQEDPLEFDHVPADAVDNPHAHAPHGIPLVVTEGDRVRAPGEAYMAALAERYPERFEYVEELVEVDGEMEAGWRDSKGEFELAYDADEEELIYWQNLSAGRLTRGRQDFVQFCASCHGFDGDGYGRSGMALRPPPRDFRQGLFKFTKVADGKLPTDENLIHLVTRGLDGTAMLPWALSEEQLSDIVQYIKTLSPPEVAWRDVYSEFGDVVSVGEDPFVANKQAAIAMGERTYHRIGCYNCHPGYVTPAKLNELADKDAATSYRDDLTYPRVDAASSYLVRGYPVMILPPDFTFNAIRVGATVEEVAQTVAAGIPGANMPTWKGSISDDEIWAIGYYIRSLIEKYKDQPAARTAFMAGLRSGA